MNGNTFTKIRTLYPTTASLATALSAAILAGDARVAAQLAWHMIFQPTCPLPMQAHAVLVHSALSLRLGARPHLIERNLRATIHRLSGGAEAKLLAKRGSMARWKIEVLAQLYSALRSLRLYGDIPFRVRQHVAELMPPSPGRAFVAEHLTEGIRKIELSDVPDGVDTPQVDVDTELVP